MRKLKIYPSISKDWLEKRPVKIISGLPPRREPLLPGAKKSKYRLWKTGVPSYSSIVLLWGELEKVHLFKPSKTGEKRWIWTIKNWSGRYRLKWFCGVEPPGIKHGQRTVIIGKLSTGNQGTHCWIHDACAIQSTDRGAFKRRLSNAFKEYVIAPSVYVDWPRAWGAPPVDAEPPED